MYYIGIDGGGTKTKFVLVNEENKLISTVEKGTCHFNQVGYDGLQRVLEDGIEELLKEENINRSEIKKVGLGLAGYGKVESIALKIKDAVKKALKDIDFVLNNDVQIAHAGALNEKDGIVVIAGTGSIGYSLNKGENKRVGGFGYTIGDEGSAYWVGRKAVECFSKEADGRYEKGALYTIFKEELALKDDYEIIAYMNEEIKADRREVAKFARFCSKAANEGDKYALDIFNDAGKELASIINTLAKDFKEKEILASYIGGLFRAEDLILNPLRENLNEGIKIVSPVYPPEVGACLLAKR